MAFAGLEPFPRDPRTGAYVDPDGRVWDVEFNYFEDVWVLRSGELVQKVPRDHSMFDTGQWSRTIYGEYQRRYSNIPAPHAPLGITRAGLVAARLNRWRRKVVRMQEKKWEKRWEFARDVGWKIALFWASIGVLVLSIYLLKLLTFSVLG